VPQDYGVIVAPRLLEQLQEFGIVEQARSAIRDAMADPEQAGKQLTGSLYPYRRLRVGRYRIIYRIASDTDPPEARFLYCGLRKQGSKKDVYERLIRALRRGDL
jgi:mRNA-degrading endonuclease RelE of RelBE toxin-antitoxin system